MKEPLQNLNYAGLQWRFLARTLDIIVLLILPIIPIICIGVIIGLCGWSQTLGAKMNETIVPITVLGTYWLYFALMESSPWQATLGKKICRIKVTDTEGNRISLLRATGRFWGMPLSHLLCLAGYLMAAFNVRHQTLHDKIARTVVLRDVKMSQTPPETGEP